MKELYKSHRLLETSKIQKKSSFCVLQISDSKNLRTEIYLNSPGSKLIDLRIGKVGIRGRFRLRGKDIFRFLEECNQNFNFFNFLKRPVTLYQHHFGLNLKYLLKN